MMTATMLFIGGPEVFFILLIVVMLFGANKIPEIARGLGQGIKEVRHAANDIKNEINSSGDNEDLRKFKEKVEKEKKEIEEITGSVKRGFKS